ncbi:MAG TPA: helix-turn-helix transcriptional regulator [Polyangiaceae bacterium]
MLSPQTEAQLKKVGRRIAELRQGAELTQEQLAAKLKITLKYLQRVEAGRHNLSVDSLVRFSRALKAEPKALFEEPRTLMVNVGRPRKRVP